MPGVAFFGVTLRAIVVSIGTNVMASSHETLNEIRMTIDMERRYSPAA